MSSPLLNIETLKKWFSLKRSFNEFLTRAPPRYVKAVDGISFKIEYEEIFVLAGESGSGKTTTGRLLVKTLEPDSGRIIFEGKDITRLKGKELKFFRKEVQMIFQDPYASLNPRFSVHDTLIEPLIVHRIGKDKKERTKLITKVLEDVKLPYENFAHRYPHMLSGGQRQRLAIARALILNPKFIVADEPVSMLDLSIRAEVLELMVSLRKKYGVSYLYITHDLSTARYIGDTLAIMYMGKIVEIGPLKDLLFKPLHPYTKALIEAIPEPDPKNRFKEIGLSLKETITEVSTPIKGCRFFPRCTYAKSVCFDDEPELLEVEKDHKVACFLA
ncbi:MAG: ABC transporter ATP-binding protein [Candidatus Bathyarchaeia archaeon]